MVIKYFRKVTLASLITMILILTLLIGTLPFATTHSGDTIIAPTAAKPVTIDGVWSTGEWSDASAQYTMTGPQTSYIRVKHNSSHLLVVIDVTWDTTASVYFWNENVFLAFDTSHNGGAAPKTDDYLIGAQTDNSCDNVSCGWGVGWRGTGSDWGAAYQGQTSYFFGTWATFPCLLRQGGSTYDSYGHKSPMSSSPNNASPHRVVEFMIPLSTVGSPGSTVGFYAIIDDEASKPGWPSGDPNATATDYSEWPPSSGGTPSWPDVGVNDPTPAPNAWGNLKILTTVGGVWVPIDKLALLAPYIALAVAICIVIIGAAYTRKRWLPKIPTLKP